MGNEVKAKRVAMQFKSTPKPTIKIDKGEMVLPNVEARSLIVRRFCEVTACITEDLSGGLTDTKTAIACGDLGRLG